MNKPAVIAALGALAHPARLDVFRQLVVAGPDGLTPTQLAEALARAEAGEFKQSTLATYLKELATAGLVEAERAGRNVIYRAAYGHMRGVIDFLTENCCSGLVPTLVDGAEDDCSC